MQNFYCLSACLLVIATSATSWATGGFSCRGETYSGKKVEVSACMPHGLPGICSDIHISVNDSEVATIPRERVLSHAWTKLEDSTVFSLQAYDEEYSRAILDIAYQFKGAPDGTTKPIFTRMKVESAGKKYSFKDITCDFE